MIEIVIARRYARALVELAAKEDIVTQVNSELNWLADILDPSSGDISVPELAEALFSPTVEQEKKIKVTDVICERMQMSKIVSDFLNVLIINGRVALAGKIAREYGRMATKVDQIQLAEVETARALSPADEQKLTAALEKTVKGKVRLHVRQNPKLLAGLRVKVGDEMLEGSALGRFTRLTNRLHG